MNLKEFHEGLLHHFKINQPQKFICKTSMLTGELKIDIIALDDYLHRIHGDYEDDGLSLSMLIEQHYGHAAHTFVVKYL